MPSIHCPHCQSSLAFEAKPGATVRGKCPKCAKILEMTIPPDETAVTQTPPPLKRPIPHRSSDDDPTTPAEAKSSVGWFLAGGGVAVVGVLLVGCIGLGAVGYFVTRTKDVPQPVVVNNPAQNDPAGNPPDNEAPPKKNDVQPPPGVKEKGMPGTNQEDKKDPGAKEEPAPRMVGLNRMRLSDVELEDRAKIIPFDAVAPRERLKEIAAVELKGRVKFFHAPNVNDVFITWESLNRLKYIERGPSVSMSSLLIRDYGWSDQGGNRMKTLSGAELASEQNFYYAMILSNLTPLMEAGFDVEKGDSVTFEGVACYSRRVKRAGRPPITLVFAEKTNQLLKASFSSARKVIGAARNIEIEFRFSEYSIVDGVNHWHKQQQWRDNGDGKGLQPYDDFTVTNINFLKNIDGAKFTLPGIEAKVREVVAQYDILDKKESIRQIVALLGPSPGSDFARLVKGLSHPSAITRGQARQALNIYADLWRAKHLPPFEQADASPLVVLLKINGADDLQTLGLEGVLQLGPQAPEAAGPLVDLANAERERQKLTQLLVALRKVAVKTPATLAVFEKHLDHSDTALKDLAAIGIIELGPETLQINRLIELMGRPNAELRQAGGKLLRTKLASVTVRDLPVLRENLKNPVRETRLAFIEAIGSLREAGKEAAPDIVPLVASADREVPEYAMTALEKMGCLVDVARDQSSAAILIPVMQSLRAKKIKTPDALSACEKHFDHPDVGVKNAAALVVLELEPERLQIDRLCEFVTRPNPEIRATADKWLRQKLASATVKDLPMLRLGLKSPSRDVCVIFVDAIAKLKNEGGPAAAEMGDLLGNADQDLALSIIKTLEAMGKDGAKGVPALEKKVGSPEKPVALAATRALCKIEPTNGVLKTQGVNALLDDLKPDGANLDALVKRPLAHESAVALLELGEPVVVPLYQQFISRNHPKMVPFNQQVAATAGRFVAYEMLKELAKKAKTSNDKKLGAALRKYELPLKVSWETLEAVLEKQAKTNFKLAPDLRQLYLSNADAAYQAYRAVSALR